MNEEQAMYQNFNMQSALQREASDSQNMMYAPQMADQMQQNQAVLVEQTNPKKIVKEIILRLQGLAENKGDVYRIAEPKMNKEGIDNMWFILDSHINQGVILSHLTQQEIGKMMDGLQTDLVDDLTMNWREYGIKKKTDLDTINNSILFNVFLALKRAEGQNEKNWLSKISVENISSGAKMGMPKKKSFWSNFLLGGGQ